MEQNTENSKKVIVIGDGVVGKTTLVAKITEGKFINNYHMTVGGKVTCQVIMACGSLGGVCDQVLSSCVDHCVTS